MKIEGIERRDDLKEAVHKRYKFDKQIRIDDVFLHEEGAVTSNFTVFYKNGKIKEVFRNIMEGFIEDYK